PQVFVRRATPVRRGTDLTRNQEPRRSMARRSMSRAWTTRANNATPNGRHHTDEKRRHADAVRRRHATSFRQLRRAPACLVQWRPIQGYGDAMNVPSEERIPNNRLKAVREERGMTQDELAEALREAGWDTCNRRTVQRYESGEIRDPTLSSQGA